MDFSLSEEAQAIRSAAARFAHERVAPAVKAYRASNEMPLTLMREFADLGYLGGVIPEAWGGAWRCVHWSRAVWRSPQDVAERCGIASRARPLTRVIVRCLAVPSVATK